MSGGIGERLRAQPKWIRWLVLIVVLSVPLPALSALNGASLSSTLALLAFCILLSVLLLISGEVAARRRA